MQSKRYIITTSIILVLVSAALLFLGPIIGNRVAFISRIPTTEGFQHRLQDATGFEILATESSPHINYDAARFVREVQSEAVLYENRNPEEVREFISLFILEDPEVETSFWKLDSEYIGEMCLCRGTVEFKFYQGTEILGSISFHHGETIRWSDRSWYTDAYLTKNSVEGIFLWLSSHGFPQLQEWTEYEWAQQVAGGDATR
ncbi:MAG: hypothetical protein AB3N14_09590 [Flavobacteriaceae bacterium]